MSGHHSCQFVQQPSNDHQTGHRVGIHRAHILWPCENVRCLWMVFWGCKQLWHTVFFSRLPRLVKEFANSGKCSEMRSSSFATIPKLREECCSGRGGKNVFSCESFLLCSRARCGKFADVFILTGRKQHEIDKCIVVSGPSGGFIAMPLSSEFFVDSANLVRHLHRRGQTSFVRRWRWEEMLQNSTGNESKVEQLCGLC